MEDLGSSNHLLSVKLANSRAQVGLWGSNPVARQGAEHLDALRRPHPCEVFVGDGRKGPDVEREHGVCG